MPIDELEFQNIKERIVNLENKTQDKFQLKYPLDSNSVKFIEDISENMKLARFENIESSLTAGFTLTPVRNYHRLVPTYKIYSDTSTAIANGEYEGQILLLEGSSNANSVLIRNNANTALDSDCTLRFNDNIFMVWQGTSWLEVARKTSEVETVSSHTHLATGFTSKARAYLNTSNQTITTGTETKVTLNAESYDVDGEFDSATNYRFTATVAGYYQVSAGVVWTAAAHDYTHKAIIRKNATTDMAVAFNQGLATTTDISNNLSDIVSLAVNDYLELFVWHNRGSDSAIKFGEEKTFLSIHRIS